MFTPTNLLELRQKIVKIVKSKEIIPDSWNLSAITDFSKLFYEINSFSRLGFIQNWDVSHVENMSSMFENCTFLNVPLNNWNVSNVKDMSSMFKGCVSFAQPLNDWDVSNVENMSCMFENCTFLNVPLNNWNVSNVKDMSSMFKGCVSFAQPLNDWDVSNVENMSSMFGSCRVFNQPLNDWNVSNVKDMSSMFAYCRVFNRPLNDWNVSKVENMSSMFTDCRVFNQPLNDWNVSNVKNTSKMFVNCDSFDQSLSKWFFDPRLLRNVENMDDMFRYAPLLLKRMIRGYDQQKIAAQMRKAAQIPIDDEKEQPFPKCVICNDYLNNNDGPGPSTKCRNNCNDVINVCENNHLFHRGCILNSCNADRVDITSQMGFNHIQTLQTQSISTTCPICREKLFPDCQGLRNKERVPTENINTSGLINKGGKRNRQFKRKTMKCKKSRKTKKSKKAKRSRKNKK